MNKSIAYKQIMLTKIRCKRPYRQLIATESQIRGTDVFSGRNYSSGPLTSVQRVNFEKIYSESLNKHVLTCFINRYLPRFRPDVSNIIN